MDAFITSLRARLAVTLPGRPAQHKMAHQLRLQELERYPALPPANARVACVLHLLHRRDEADPWRTVLIQRTSNPRDRHSGQISFPGGSWEEIDGNDLAAVALRETHEEIGVSPVEVEVLGRLTELYIPVSNFVVHPFVGLLMGAPNFLPQPGEVEAVLTPSLDSFRQVDSRRMTDMTLPSGMALSGVPYFDVEGHIVWGATAMILSEFLEVLPTL